MQAIEFRAKIKNGFIEIPNQYSDKLSDRVRVILLVEQTPATTGNLINQLLAHPVRVQGFYPLTREEVHAR
jgi:ureidoglycolate hydrolase